MSIVFASQRKKFSVSLVFLLKTGSCSPLLGHLSHLVGRGRYDELLWAALTDLVLPGERWREQQHDDEEEEEEAEEESGGQHKEGGEWRLLSGRRHVFH